MRFRGDFFGLIPWLGSPSLKVGIFAASSTALAACSAIEGYPADPENSAAMISSLSAYFDPSLDYRYNQSSDPIARRELRDTIVLSRMRAYDIEFDNFERNLYSQGNSATVAGSLATITMGAVGGVAGAAVTKSILNVSSAAVTGAENIPQNLIYQRALPALISQMEADRTLAKANILAGVKQSDTAYPLVQAYVDLETLKNAGGIPTAIAGVTQSAANNQQLASAQLEKLRDVTFKVSSSNKIIEAWLHAAGPISAANPNFQKLSTWMRNDKIDPVLSSIPVATFLSDPELEGDRQRAIKDLGIPSK